MIHTCTEVVVSKDEHEGEVDGLLDEVERDILRTSETWAESNTGKIKDLVKEGDQHDRRLPPAAGNADGRGDWICRSR